MARPILKWAGGKTQLLPEILKRLPDKIATYHEPFVGGGAVFFALAAEGRFERAVLSDTNSTLINMYEQLRDHPNELIKGLKRLAKTHSEEQFYGVRQTYNRLGCCLNFMQSVYLIYLNKTGFNGLYRVNKSGNFNVPFGDYKNPNICDEDNLRAASQALQGVKLKVQDFSKACSSISQSVQDAVYFDPPYLPISKTSNFTAYSGNFNIEHHCRLAKEFSELARAGVPVLLSNSDTPTIRELYAKWKIETVSARRSINSKGAKRGAVSELLVTGKRAKR